MKNNHRTTKGETMTRANKRRREEENMSDDDKRLFIESIATMRELKGELREFKLHVIGRVEKLEKKESDRSKERLSVFSVLIAFTALAMNIIVNFFRNGGK